MFSKTKGIAGNVTWTDQDIIPVSFYHASYVSLGDTFGTLEIAGRDMFLQGYRIDVQNPSTDLDSSVQFDLVNGDGTVVPLTTSTLTGIQAHLTNPTQPPIGLPSGSYWHTKVTGLTGSQGLGFTLTYLLSYANSPVQNAYAVYKLGQSGIGYWRVGFDFTVTPS